MFLDTTTRKLQIVLTTATTTNVMPVLVDYVDITTTTTTPGLQPSNTNGTTLVDILPAPAASTQRKVNGITIYNADTVSKVVRIYLNDNSTSYQIIDLTIQVDDTLCYTDVEGWYTIDLNGCRKVITSTQLGVANTWTAQQTFTQSSIVPSLQFNDNSTKEANTAFVQAVQGLNMATMPLANITGGTFSFAGLGSGCTLTYTVTGNTISSVTAVAAGGSGYAVGDCLLVTGGNYDSVIRVATITGSAVATVTILYGGTGYSNGTAVSTSNALADPFKWRLSGTLTSTATFILPNGTYLTASDQYIIANNTTGAFTISFFVSNGANATTGTGAVITQGSNNNAEILIETDGLTDVWLVVPRNVITLGTPVVSTSGTSILITGIPSWAKRITINFKGVGTSGTSFKLIQIGSGSVASSGYLGASSGFSTVVATSNFTAGFGINSAVAADRLHGTCTLTLENSSNNTWIASGVMAASNGAGMQTIAGSVSLAGAIDRVNITTANGTDTFAAGEINITYE